MLPRDQSSMASSGQGSKRVKFSRDIRVHKHPHINDMAVDQIAGVWYNQEELNEISLEASKTVIRMTEGRKLRRSNGECSRGLEHYTIAGATTRLEHRQASWDSVLVEQEEQSQRGIYDALAIAVAYSSASRASTEDAIILAKHGKARKKAIEKQLKKAKQVKPDPPSSFRSSPLVLSSPEKSASLEKRVPCSRAA